MSFRIIKFVFLLMTVLCLSSCFESTCDECLESISIHANCPMSNKRMVVNFFDCQNSKEWQYLFMTYPIDRKQQHPSEQECETDNNVASYSTCVAICNFPLFNESIVVSSVLSQQDSEAIRSLFFDDSGNVDLDKYSDCRDDEGLNDAFYETTSARMLVSVYGENGGRTFSFDNGVQYSPESMAMKATIEDIFEKIQEESLNNYFKWSGK